MRILCLLFLYFMPSMLFAQDIVFRNHSETQVAYYLDTTFSVDSKHIKLVIGPERKTGRNTIFFNGPFEISNSYLDSFQIKGSYLRHLIIKHTQFNSPISIDSTDFDTLSFNSCNFKYPVIIKDAVINNLTLLHNIYKNKVSFINCSIVNFDCSHTIVPVSLSFINCRFENLNFRGTLFKENIQLQKISVTSMASFDSCIFQRNLEVTNIQTTVSTKLSFTNIYLPDTLNFSSNSVLPNTVDFTKAFKSKTSDNKCKLLLAGTDIAKVSIQYILFQLVFPNFASNDEKHSTYESLLQNFKQNNLEESYRNLDIEYHRFKIKSGSLGFLWWFPEYWSNYGYNKEYIFRWTFGFLFAFTILNFFLLNWLVMKVYSLPNIPMFYRKYNFTRAWYSLVYTFIVFFSLSLKFDKLKLQNKIGTVYIYIVYIIGIICLAYLANFVIQK